MISNRGRYLGHTSLRKTGPTLHSILAEETNINEKADGKQVITYSDCYGRTDKAPVKLPDE